MPFPHLFLITGAVIFGSMTLLWLLSLILKNASIVDIFWGIGFIIVTWLAFAVTPQGYLPRKLLLGTLVTIWGLRLAIHIGIRNAGNLRTSGMQRGGRNTVRVGGGSHSFRFSCFRDS